MEARHRKGDRASREGPLCRFEQLEPRLLLSTGLADELLGLIGYEGDSAGIAAVGIRVSPPDRPEGPSTGFVGQRLTYSTEGTDPLNAHKYMFDWGDGSKLSWKSNDTQSHVYTAPGTYSIRAKEKCPLDVFVTGWSKAMTVTIMEQVPNGAAPVLDNTGDMSLDSVDEDDRSNVGTEVSEIIASAGGDRVTDTDATALEGIAVIAVDNSQGTWQYSSGGTGSWRSFEKVSETNAYLLPATDKVRFVPKRNFNGMVTDGITFRAWDQTNWEATGRADTTVNGGTTAFSTATETASVTVEPVNDAPVLNTKGYMWLNPVDAESGTNPGTLVSAIIASAGGDRITDIDAGAVEGIAVTAVKSVNGTWEYSTDGGATWSAMGAPSDSGARLLRDIDVVRFVPNAGFRGLVSGGITFRAWDQTKGTAGGTHDTWKNGGTTAFSTRKETASVVVNPVTVTAKSRYKTNRLSVRLRGVGECDLVFAQNGYDLDKIVLRGTDWRSSLSIGVRKDAGRPSRLITLGEVDFEQDKGEESHLRRIKATRVDLVSIAPPSITPLPPDSVLRVQLHNYTYPGS